MLGLFIPLTLFFDPFHEMFNLVHATRAILVTALGGFLMGLLFLEAVRLTNPNFEAFFFRYFGFLMKESERKRFNGTVPYFFANFLVVLFFPPEIAILAILFLVVGDPVAAYVGSKYGSHRFYNGKSREGVIGFLVPTYLISILMTILITNSSPGSFFALYHEGGMVYEILLILLFGVVVSCLTEFFSNTTAKGLIDDNLLIPLAGAVTLSIFSLVLLPHTPMEFFFSPQDLYLEK